MVTVIDIAFAIGDFVYLRTDPYQDKRIVTAFCVKPEGITYQLSRGMECSWHFDLEISKTRNIEYTDNL